MISSCKIIGVFLLIAGLSGALADSGDQPQLSSNIVAEIHNLTRIKVLESNNVSLRPGSIYDNVTQFESLLQFPHPGFNYEFYDSGLGAAEPLYPMYQKGYQGSWMQLLPAFFSDTARHVDHFTTLDTPEGCRVIGTYLLRSLTEYPDDFLPKERAEGYTQTVTRLEYYMRLNPAAQCGRHVAHDPDPGFDPTAFLDKYHNAMSLKDYPQNDINRFEAKFMAIYHITQELNSLKYRRFDLRNMKHNSLWFYPEGHAEDYGISQDRPQPQLQWFRQAKHMAVMATPGLQKLFPLDSMLTAKELGKLMDFLHGHPTPDFDPTQEPGQDTLNIADVTSTNIYTSGLDLEHIQNVEADVSDLKNFKLVGMTIKPYEEQVDSAWTGIRIVPQIRFVYQMMNPRTGRPVEQLFLHLKWDVIDRLADAAVRDQQHRYFLSRIDQVAQAREQGLSGYEGMVTDFIKEFTGGRPIESLNFGSSLTGIWVFGSLSRSYNPGRDLQATRIIRDGIDVGYYSSAYDNDIFRAALKVADDDQAVVLQKHMDDVTVGVYRDPKRQDPHAINFNRMTCAQCHQTSGRDGVHMAFNDGIDRRITTLGIISEYFFHDADSQLQAGQTYWSMPREPSRK